MNLKTIILGSTLLFFAALAFTSCDNASDTETLNLITEDNAIEVIESVFLDGTEGVTNEIEDAASIARTVSLTDKTYISCNESFDSSLVKDVDLSRLTAAYSTAWNWSFTCNNYNVPEVLLFGREAIGNYETLRFNGNTQSTSNWTVSDLILGPVWVYNGTFDRTGSHLSSINNENNLRFMLKTTFSDLEVDKHDLKIIQGQGTLNLTLTDDLGNSLNAEGSIVFNGDETATVNINGNTYEILSTP